MYDEITKLAPDDYGAFTGYLNKWRNISYGLNQPRRKDAESAITTLFQEQKLGTPDFIWCQSPFSMLCAMALLLVPDMESRLVEELPEGIARETRSIFADARSSLGLSKRFYNFHAIYNHLRFEYTLTGDADLGYTLSWGIRQDLRKRVKNNGNEAYKDQMAKFLNSALSNAVGAPLVELLALRTDQRLEDTREGKVSLWNRVLLNLEHTPAFTVADFARHHLGIDRNTDKLVNGMQIGANCSGFIPLPGLCLVAEPPSMAYTDESGLLHSEQSAALNYADGWSMHWCHGQIVDLSITDLERLFRQA